MQKTPRKRRVKSAANPGLSPRLSLNIDEIVNKVSNGAKAAMEEEDCAFEERHAIWMEDADRTRHESGLTAAEDAQEEADDVRLEIRDRIAVTRDRTLDRLIFKARFAAAHFEGDPDEDVVASILDDLVAMAGEGV
jgi:hypothetical protein